MLNKKKNSLKNTLPIIQHPQISVKIVPTSTTFSLRNFLHLRNMFHFLKCKLSFIIERGSCQKILFWKKAKNQKSKTVHHKKFRHGLLESHTETSISSN